MTARKENFKLIFGLGNPGEEFENTYHNAGVIATNFLASRGRERKFKSHSSKLFEYASDKSTYAKSKVFMNDSGKAIAAALKFFKLKPSDILLVHDDSDIPLGKYKISFGSRSAGHNGVESVIKSLRTLNFHRLRIGVRSARGKASQFVLKKIKKEDNELLKRVFLEIEALNLEI